MKVSHPSSLPSSSQQASNGIWVPGMFVNSYPQQSNGFRIPRKSKHFRVARLCIGPQGMQQQNEITYQPRFTSKSAEPKQIQPQMLFSNTSISPPPTLPQPSPISERSEAAPSVFDIVRRGNFPGIIYDVRTSSISLF
ncbi:hypothetical protein GPJ56_010446 [Histomonas meleagridis]|uniref:uncharacterized protein n=1 Tax=Histomonas meleagridis TaxID=135588 RepID=UPI00355A4C26|nr:hypothetical protein GPJ56_010446 [Histomonas meleagridis]KAH0798995.1 hypothetical protein GO595_008147 [Histomonas meleagridis]